MLGSLITLPLRLGVRGAGLALRGAAELTDRVAGLAGLVAGALGRRSEPEDDLDGAPVRTSPRAAPAATPEYGPPSPSPALVSAPPPPPPPPPPPRPPAEPATAPIEAPRAHVSEEPVLVAEVAEPGAEAGAGAEVRVAEPWEGYRQMNAADVIDRIIGATAAELAAVKLYELSGRGRKSVLDAADSALQSRA